MIAICSKGKRLDALPRGQEGKIHRITIAHHAVLLFVLVAVAFFGGTLVAGCVPAATPTPLPTPTPYLLPIPTIVPRAGYVVGRPSSPWGPIPEYKVILYGPLESDKPLEIPFEASDYATFAFPVKDEGTYIITFLEPKTDLRICEYQLLLSPLESAVVGCDSGAWLAPWTDYPLE